MSLQTLTLDLAKITAYTPQTPTIRQNDAGESLPIILGRGGEAIDLTKSVVTLYLEKSSGKIIQVSSDTAPDAWTINDDGTMSVVLPPETYQAHGDIKVGYLRIKTGDLVESTSSFSIRVLPAKGSPEADDSYISDAAKIVGDIKSKDAAAQVVLEQTRAKYTELDTAMATATKATSKANDAAKSATDAAGKATDATADTIEIKKSTEDLLAKIPTDPAYKGPKGDTGDTGEKGDKGDKGDTGSVDNDGLTTAPAFVNLQTQVTNSAVGTNLIIKSSLTLGYIRKIDGIVVPYSGNDFHSDNYIATNGATAFTLSSPDYVFKGSSNHSFAMYDSDKNYLGWQAITSPTQTLSNSNVAYIRISIHFLDEGGTYNKLSDWLNNHRYKLEKGSVATDWCPNPSEILIQSDYAKIQAAIVALGGSLS